LNLAALPMHIIEHRDTLVLTNGEGSPLPGLLTQSLVVSLPCLAIALLGLSVAARGHLWGWLLFACLWPVLADARSYLRDSNATVVLDRRTGRVRIEQRFAFATRSEALALADVVALTVDRRDEADGPRYAPMLALRDGRRLQLGPPAPRPRPLRSRRRSSRALRLMSLTGAALQRCRAAPRPASDRWPGCLEPALAGVVDGPWSG